MPDPIQLDPFVFGDDRFRAEEQRRQRERDEEARRAAQEALQRLQEPTGGTSTMTGPERPGEASRAMEDARGAASDEERLTPWSQMPGATVQPYTGDPSRRPSQTSVTFPPGQLPLPQRAQTIDDALRGRQPMEQTRPPADPGPMARTAPQRTERDPIAITPLPGTPQPTPVRTGEAGSPPSAVTPVRTSDRAALLGSPRQPSKVGDWRPSETTSASPQVVTSNKPQYTERETLGQAEGLPTDDDIRRAEGTDWARRIAYALGAGLSAAAGRSTPAFRSEAEALRERRDEGVERGMRAKQGARAEERAAAESAAESEARRETLASQERRQQVRVSAQDRIAQSRERLAEAQAALAEARTSGERARAAIALDAATATSDTSRRARSRYVLEALARERVRPESERRTREQIEADVAGLSAADIVAMEGELESVTLGNRGRSAGGGMGAGGQRASREELEAAAVDAGVPGAVARTMDSRRLAAAIEQRTRTEGEEILPGVRAGIGLDRGEGRRIRQEFAQAASQYGSLGEVDEIASRFGSGAVVSPEAAAEMTAPLTRLRAMVARLQNTGVINPSEAPAIEAMLPNPTDLRQMTFGTLRGRLRSFRTELERAVDAEMMARGVDDEGRRTAIGLLRGSAGSGERGGSTPRGDTVTISVTGSDGQPLTREVPRGDVDRYRRLPGFRMVE